jgi:F0F1-type ATP synthase membrane subunit b/b'
MAAFLDRFRRLTPPGAALPGGAVPADPQLAAAAELQPVFAAAAAIERDAEAIRAGARELAGTIVDQARSDADAIVAAAADEATRARAGAVARVQAELIDRRTSLIDEADRRVRVIDESAAADHERRLDAVVARVRALAPEVQS